MRPPRPASRKIRRRRAVQEEDRLQVDVELRVPVLLGHLVDRVPAPQDGRRADEHVEAAERVARPPEQGVVRREVAQVGADREVAAWLVE